MRGVKLYQLLPNAVDLGTEALPAELVLMLLVMALHPPDKGFLPACRGPCWVGVHPSFEFRMEGIEVPSRALLPQEGDRLVGNDPARRLVR